MTETNPETETEAIVAIDEALIDKSVEFINKTIVKTFFKGSLEIGEYLLEHFFDNDIELASSRNPHKPVSFQALCKRPDLGIHPSTLSRMVRVASQERYFVMSKAKVDELSYSHKLEFIKLPNDKKKIRLAEKCIREKMSCRKLSETIFETRKKTKGVLELSPLKLISNVDKLIEGTQIPTLLSKPDKLESMRSKTRTEMRERANNLLERMETLTEECGNLIETLDEIDKRKEREREQKEREKEELRAKREKERKEKEEQKAKEKEEAQVKNKKKGKDKKSKEKPKKG